MAASGSGEGGANAASVVIQYEEKLAAEQNARFALETELQTIKVRSRKGRASYCFLSLEQTGRKSTTRT